MNKYYILMIFCFLGLSYTSVGQRGNEEENKSGKNKGILPDKWKEKMSFGLQVGIPYAGYPQIDLSLQVGYKASDNIIFGGQFNYLWGGTGAESYNYVGPGLYSRIFLTEMVFLTAEGSLIRSPYYENYNSPNRELKHKWVGVPLIGGGYKRGVFDENTFTYAALMYYVSGSNVTVTPYIFPLVFKVGIVF